MAREMRCRSRFTCGGLETAKEHQLGIEVVHGYFVILLIMSYLQLLAVPYIYSTAQQKGKSEPRANRGLTAINPRMSHVVDAFIPQDPQKASGNIRARSRCVNVTRAQFYDAQCLNQVSVGGAKSSREV